MARTKGSKNKSTAQTSIVDPIQDTTSLMKKEKGAGLRAYRERKKAEKELAVSNRNEESIPSREEHMQTFDSAHEALDKKGNSTIAMIRKILRSNEPQKCYLIVEF